LPPPRSAVGTATLIDIRLRVFRVEGRYCLARSFETVSNPGWSAIFSVAAAATGADRQIVRVHDPDEYDKDKVGVAITKGQKVVFERTPKTS
jgi:hypothetical protein